MFAYGRGALAPRPSPYAACMFMDAVDMLLALGRAPGLTAQQLRAARTRLAAPDAHCAPLAELLAQPRERLQTLGIPAAASAALAAPPAAAIAADHAWVQRAQIALIDADHALYPPLLAQTRSAPALMYLHGDASALCLPQLAIVGSRSPTETGRRTARQFAAHLSQAGLAITSGMALGIDAASHEGALAADGRTIAVLGGGLDRIYPSRHHELAQRIATRGALVSEFPPGTAPLPQNFPRRNRIISGLALGTLVVEAARHSGSLLTAQLALDQGREVFAVPGSIHNPLTRGCHALIRDGAKLVESAQDVLEELQFSQPQQLLMPLSGGASSLATAAAALDKEYKILLDALGFEPAGVDELVERTGLPSQSVASMLLILELEGAVEAQSGGRYMRLPDGPPTLGNANE
jgi:DNA processing protein